MQTKHLLPITALLLALSLPTAAMAHAEHGQPQFGGVVAEAGEAQFEVVGKDGRLFVHVTNHGSPLDTTGASGKLTVLAGSAKQEYALKPAGGNRLEGSGSYGAGAKLLLQVQLPGKKLLQARALAR
ncbi:hypothetical protein [Ferribacterium limneticum]|uniref:hypothetical protein n=1 Tax=Ferribacterium limneticum TaxID=76259 RepID=UPI001CFC2822|nr:hypothetical protein [Ferribacterium limneticum]UCV30537.1 hypothetical protein KI617_04530 [Ferribacterium limneticum]UCV34454.1 hypothetical protein KI608_04530 [Ferribacterium limneticum]